MTRGADMVIVEQASRLLLNYALLLGREPGGPRVAFWGQGRNVLPHRASPAGEAVKRVVSRRVDWWFAYNERSVDVVRELGFAPYRITCVQNAIDTRTLARLRAGDEPRTSSRRLARRGLASSSGHVGVFAGACTPTSGSTFLVEASDLVRAGRSPTSSSS